MYDKIEEYVKKHFPDKPAIDYICCGNLGVTVVFIDKTEITI